MKKVLFSLVAMLLLSVSGFAQNTTFTKVTSASGLEAGANYLIVAHHDDLGVLAMGYQKTNNRNAVVVSENGESITVTPGTDPSSETDVFQFTLGGNAGAWTFFDEVKGGYLYAASSSSNNLKTQTTLDANGEWSIVFNADGTALDNFLLLDDYDIWASLKVWQHHDDPILALLSRNLLSRNIFKVEVSDTPFEQEYINSKILSISDAYGISHEQIRRYLIAEKEVGKDMYNLYDDRIEILDKDGSITDVADVSDMLNIETLSKHVKKYYLCYQRI